MQAPDTANFVLANFIRVASMLSPEVREAAARSVLCWLATADDAGQPSVSPKEVFAAFDATHLVVANIASPTSVRNVKRNPRVCMSFIDVFVQKGFKIMGNARNVTKDDAEFPVWSAPLMAKAGPRFPIHSVLVIEAFAVEPVIAPSYRLYAGETTEESQIASAMRTYGVRPAHGDMYCSPLDGRLPADDPPSVKHASQPAKDR